MKSLILEDYYTLKGNFFIILGILIVYGILFIPTSGYSSFILVTSIIFSLNIVIRSMMLDEMSRWMKQVLVIPIKRSDYVLNKYLLLVISILLGIFIGVLISIGYLLLSELMNHPVTWNFSLIDLYILILTFCYPLIGGSISICLSFIFGFDKFRVFAIAIYLIPAGIIYFMDKYFNLPSINLNSIMFFIPILTISIVIISYIISLYYFRKKEI